LSLLPFNPPLQTSDLTPIKATIGTAPEDFIVDELPLYPASGSGEHLYVRLRKRELATPDLLRIVSRATRIKERDIGCAGMKDKHAITSQWLSFPLGCPEPSTWELPETIEILESTRHGNKLRTGHLLGNRFRIRLLGVEPTAYPQAELIAQRLREAGLINYFGAQRFGIQGRNLSAALHVLTRQSDATQTDHESQVRNGARRFYAKFNPSVIQSEIFNRYAKERLLLGKDQIFAGETVRLEGSPKTFIVEDVNVERQRLFAGALHLTGPIFGSGSRLPAGEPGELIVAILGELGLTQEDIKRFGRDARGTVRDLIIPLPDLELSEESGSLVLAFTLPAGSYATQLIREFTHGEFLSGQRAPHATPSTESEQQP